MFVAESSPMTYVSPAKVGLYVHDRTDKRQRVLRASRDGGVVEMREEQPIQLVHVCVDRLG
jgi:hypothetical protein